jgi:glucan phosphoethanolaminetransferase (alkaline phosphatase superfamily)
MLIVNKPLAIMGLILVFVAGFCPILQVKIIFEWVNWGLYKTDIRLFLITYSFIALLSLCFFIRQLKAFRLLTRVMFIWVLLMAAAVYFKSTHYFGMKIADNLLGKAIHFQWGWIILGIGAILLLLSVKKERLSV